MNYEVNSILVTNSPPAVYSYWSLEASSNGDITRTLTYGTTSTTGNSVTKSTSKTLTKSC